MKIPASTESFLFGALAGAVVLALIGFNWGGWMTSAKAEQYARVVAQDAMVEMQTPICVAQFRKAPNAKSSLAELVAKDRWDQADYVREGGWATMPGSTGDAGRDVAEACAKTLAKRDV